MMKNAKVLRRCVVYQMLKHSKKHISFHTPGHKYGKWDITELPYSDNLSTPTGVLMKAEEEIAEEVGAYKSFILVDGSTCGVLAMMFASKAKKILIARDSHKSVYNGAKLFNICLKVVDNFKIGGVPQTLTFSQIEKNAEGVDAILLTYPDYYGNLADLSSISKFCKEKNIFLLIDGAHGSMFKGTPKYAGNFADIWVDGVHKNLPCLTQGALVSCSSERFVQKLKEGLDIFRTTSPNYILTASVEYGVKSVRNSEIEAYAEAFKAQAGAYRNGDWSKAVFSFGSNADAAEKFFESHGVYPEFNDGENILFYFSWATKKREIDKLSSLLTKCRKKFPPVKAEEEEIVKAVHKRQTEEVELSLSVGRICAENCGLFPPCIPLIADGEVIRLEQVEKLTKAENTYGITDNKIKVYVE